MNGIGQGLRRIVGERACSAPRNGAVHDVSWSEEDQVRIGIGLPNQIRNVRAPVIPEWARRAEELGFSTVGTSGRLAYPGVMDTVALAAAAGATTSIGLMSTVLLSPVWPAGLLAKEAASIDEVSGGRLTLGVGVGGREDDYLVEGFGPRGRGKRMDGDLEVYESLWRGTPPTGSDQSLVTEHARKVPLLFGGSVQATFDRVARFGKGYVTAALPPAMVAPTLESVRATWKDAGRKGDPYLVAVAYFALSDADAGRDNVRDYYTSVGSGAADLLASGVGTSTGAVRETIRDFADLGVDELILNPATDDVDEVARLAEAVL